jgi:glycosyltransferase involved in cell wall biosynthesis
MKILLATFWVIPHLGGVWNYMLQLKAKLESLGHEVDLLGYGEDQKYIHLANANRLIERRNLITVVNKVMNPPFSTHYKNPLLKFYDSNRHFYELGAAYLGLENYDLIHTQDVIATACINRIRPEGTPLVATVHGSVAQELNHTVTHNYKIPSSHLLRKYFDKLEYEGATAAEITIVANEWLKNNLTNKFFVPATQLKVSHYGYNTEQFLKQMKETSSSIERPANKKVLLFTGRLVELKGLQYLIYALSHLKKKRTDWICWIVGEGSLQTDLQKQAKILELHHDVLFLGKRNDIPYLLSIADIFILPSLIENQPLSLIEAQIAGKPAIVSDAGGLPEMVKHGVTGLISPAGDEHALCKNVNLLLTDEKFSHTLGANAQKWGLVHWSLDRAIKNVLDIYQEAILKKKSSPLILD